jgi:hypothetical protein
LIPGASVRRPTAAALAARATISTTRIALS